MTRLNEKCVKIVDSDITENTSWRKCYVYVITQDVTVKEGVLLKIQDGTKVYLVNEYLTETEELTGGLTFNKARLCAKDLCIGSVDYDGKYFYLRNKCTTEKDYFNFGVTFIGTRFPLLDAQEALERQLTKNKCYERLSDKQKEKYCACLSKCYKNNGNSYNKCLYKLDSLTLNYVYNLRVSDVDERELCVKNVTLCNSFEFYLFNSYLSLCNLSYQNYGYYSGQSSINFFNSVLKVKECLTAKGLSSLFSFNDFETKSTVYLFKGLKLNVEAISSSYDDVKVCPPKNNLYLDQTPWCIDTELCTSVKFYIDETLTV